MTRVTKQRQQLLLIRVIANNAYAADAAASPGTQHPRHTYAKVFSISSQFSVPRGTTCSLKVVEISLLP